MKASIESLPEKPTDKMLGRETKKPPMTRFEECPGNSPSAVGNQIALRIKQRGSRECDGHLAVRLEPKSGIECDRHRLKLLKQLKSYHRLQNPPHQPLVDLPC